MGEARRSTRGAAIIMSGSLIRIALNILVVLPILARILSPDEFGIAAMSMTLFAFLAVFGDFGLAPAMVRTPNPSDEMWASALWTTLMIGGGLAFVAWLSAPFLGAYYGHPEIVSMARVLGFAMLLQVLGSIPICWLQKHQQLSKVALIDLISVIASAGTAVVAAVMGAGVWALIVQQVVLAGVKFLCAIALSRVPILARYSWGEIRHLTGFSLRLTASGFVTFLNRQSDTLLIGRFMGADALGLYSRAYQLMQLPNQVVARGISFAAYPAMAKVSSDPVWLRLLFLKLNAAVGLMVIPVMLALAVISKPIIGLLLGPQWLSIAQTFTVLAIAGAVQSLNTPSTDALKVLGHTDRLLAWSLIRLALFLPSFAIGVWLGSTFWLAVLYTGANLLLFFPFQAEVANKLGIPLKLVLARFAPSLIGALVMVAILLGVHALSPPLWGGSLTNVLLLCGVAALSFLTASYVTNRGFLIENTAHLRHFMREKRSA